MIELSDYRARRKGYLSNPQNGYLDLSRMILPSSRSSDAIARELCTNTTITSLKLGNHIGAEGMQTIANALRVNATLTTLNFVGPKQSKCVVNSVAHAVIEALRVNHTLTSVCLGDGISPVNFLEIKELLARQPIRHAKRLMPCFILCMLCMDKRLPTQVYRVIFSHLIELKPLPLQSARVNVMPPNPTVVWV